MKQRFQVYQNGMLAAGQKIFKVKISGLQRVKNGQVLSLPFHRSDRLLHGTGSQQCWRILTQPWVSLFSIFKVRS